MARKDQDVALLPEGSDLVDQDYVDEDDPFFDEADISINFTDKEATSEARLLEALPTGLYEVFFTEIEPKRCGPSSKNPGKPYWAVTLTVDGGDYDGRRLWTNVMLFNGALYTLAQILNGLGLPLNQVPPRDTLIGKKLIAVVSKQKDTYKIDRDGWDKASGEPMPMKNEVRGFRALGDTGPSKGKRQPGKVSSGQTGSLLP